LWVLYLPGCHDSLSRPPIFPKCGLNSNCPKALVSLSTTLYDPHMDFASWTGQIKRLHQALGALTAEARIVGVEPPLGEEWYELLLHRLLPQVDAEPALVVAVTGGTNLGKSAIFNQLAGETASRVSPLAARTKHPVCLAPATTIASNEPVSERLARLFEGFELRPWQSPDDAITECEQDLLFWRTSDNVPPRLLLLDTPDIDSSAEVNWRRADTIRRTADVLIAVLTEQKYNDASVKQFFRKAVEADKPVVVVFNQCDLKDDRTYWPQWLETFMAETGAKPELVYVVPKDRTAAAELRLPFYSVGPQGQLAATEPGSLREDLAALHFDTIKIRTFRGAVSQVLDRTHGAVAYLGRVRRASDEFGLAAAVLAQDQIAGGEWPSLPTPLVVEEIRSWWDEKRDSFSRKVHGFYRQATALVVRGVKAGWSKVAGPAVDPLAAFHLREREAIVRTVEATFDLLQRLAEGGNDVLRPRLQTLLKGNARADLLSRLRAAYDELPAVGNDFREFVREELDAQYQQNPRTVKFLHSLDNCLAIGRPAITVAMFVSGLSWTGADQAIMHMATTGVTEVVKETVITTTLTGAGEAAIAGVGETLQQQAARIFTRLQAGYTRLRVRWLAEWLHRELLGELVEELHRGAAVRQSAAIREVEASLNALDDAERMDV
jgi:GTPase SAR1 family protein